MLESTRILEPTRRIWFAVLIISSHVCMYPHAKDITLGFLVPFNLNGSYASGKAQLIPGKYFAAAISLAVEAVNNNSNLLPRQRINFIWNDTLCNEERSLRELTEHWHKNVDAFIGPGCSCDAAARLAAAWNLPMVSYVSIN